MRCILLILIVLLNQGCIAYFSKPLSTRLYKPRSSPVRPSAFSDSLKVMYSISYDSTAQNPNDEHFLKRGQQFEDVSMMIRSKTESLFNFGFQHVMVNEVQPNLTANLVQRDGRTEWFANDDLLPRPLFGRVFINTDSAWLTDKVPVENTLLLEIKFGKRAYTTSYAYLNSYVYVNVHFIRKDTVLYSRLWVTKPCCEWQVNNIDNPKIKSNRWFTEENFLRLAKAIHRDLKRNLMQ